MKKTLVACLAVVAVLALASSASLPRTTSGPGRVCALSATSARHLDSDYRFVLGLGERSFPRSGDEPWPVFFRLKG